MPEAEEAPQGQGRSVSASSGTADRDVRPSEPGASHQPPSPQPGFSPTISIGAGCAFEGLLTFRGETRVDGDLVGEVVASGTLRLGKTARVRARIEVDELIVDGELEGDVVARRRLELSSTARVRGSLEAARFSLAEGCLLEGRLRSLP